MENRKKEGMKAGAAAEDSAGIPLTGGENGQGESPRGRSNKSKGSKRIIIFTGLYPESHGIIDNRMYDPSRNASFSLKDKEKFVPSWYLGEPVWLTAKYNGLKSGTYFWPGSDVNISGSFPDKYMKFNKSKDFEERLYTILHWLALPKGERPDFYTLYLDEPDTSGHKYGPSSRQVEDALKRVDKIVEMLMDGLKQMKLHKCANVVLVSDHGMEESTCEKSVILSEFIPNTDDFVMRTGAAGRLMPTDLSVYSTYDYKNLMDNLTAIFIGYGPLFKFKTKVEPFENIEIYNLLCVAATNKSNMPYGRPRHLVSESYCLLYQRDYVTGYSTTYRTPLWSSYTIQPKDLSHRSSASSPQSSDCVRLDPRLSDGYHHGCAIYRRNLNITTGFLHPPDFSFAESRPDSLISSNMVPLYPDFKVIWLYLHNIFLPSYAKGKKGVNVISGQAFDNNFDGLVDSSEYMKSIPGIATPTHYFVIVSSCKTESELPETCEDSLDVVSFILPHRETYEEICTAQRCVLPPALFNACMDWVLGRVMGSSGRGASVGEERFTDLDFADDSVIFAESMEALIRALKRLSVWACEGPDKNQQPGL
ncbi:ENPP3 phosphodiesterase, partial [Polypterus senegalus]